jgi:autotransporter-associated beta strand protein
VTKEGTGIVTLKASGGNTYSGVTKINTGTLKLVSTSTNNIAFSPLIDLAAGATLEISGMTHANQFVLANGQTLKGSGTVDGFNLNPNGRNPLANMTVGNGSTLSPGNSTGTLTVFNAKETWASGGTYAWQLLNTTGEAGTDWDLTAVTGTDGTVASNLAVTATAGSKFNIALQTLSGIAPDVQGTAGDWTANDPHSWKIASSAGAITGWDVDDDAASDLFNIDTTNFVGAGTGSSFNVSKTGNDVFLNYVPSSGPIVVLGDTNEDGVVDAADYIAIKTNFGLTGTGITKFQGDLIDNDIVDWADLQELMAHFGDTSGAPAAMTMNNTPEPATLGLLAIGALAVIRRRQGYGGQVRRRRARA